MLPLTPQNLSSLPPEVAIPAYDRRDVRWESCTSASEGFTGRIRRCTSTA